MTVAALLWHNIEVEHVLGGHWSGHCALHIELIAKGGYPIDSGHEFTGMLLDERRIHADADHLGVERRELLRDGRPVAVPPGVHEAEVARAGEGAHLLLQGGPEHRRDGVGLGVELGQDPPDGSVEVVAGILQLAAWLDKLGHTTFVHDCLGMKAPKTIEANAEVLAGLVVHQLGKAGAPFVMGVGTDTIGGAHRMIPNLYIAELKWFVKGGYSIPDTLKAATITNARLLDMDDKLGSLEAGKLADLIVLDGRPDENLDDLQNVDMVVKDGRLLVRGGQVVVPRHVPVPLPKAAPPADVR